MGNYWQSRQLNFNAFLSRADFIQQGKEANEYVLNNILPSDISLYRDTSRFKNLGKYENEKTYEKPNDLEYELNRFDNLFQSIDMGGAFKKSKLKITDDKRGIFDFSLAAKGLYRRQEYFSIELATELPEEFNTAQYNFKPSGVVPSEFVSETFIGEQRFYWYAAKSGKEYQLTLQQEGTRAVELGLPNAKLAYATKTKKSYVMFEKKGGKAKMVELFMPVNQGIDLATALPLFLAAKFFQSYSIMTRINVIRMYGEGNDYVAWAYPVKDYTEELDFNYVALNAIDTRWWYSIQSVVKAINNKIQIEKKKNAGFTGKLGLGDFQAYRGSGNLPENSKAYVELFSRYRNWYTQQIEKGFLPPLRVDKKLLISGVDEKYYNAGNVDMKATLTVFFRILDTVDFQFNNAESCCQRIYKRMVEDKLGEYYETVLQIYNTQSDIDLAMQDQRITLTAEFKTYVQSVLFDTYDYPVGGAYEEDKESAKKLEEELDEKLEKLTQFLKTI